MRRQTFANPEAAQWLNQQFVCVIVDREEHPGLAALYRAYVEDVKQLSGWPLNIWLTPELQPFEGAAYLSPSEDWGRPGFLKQAKQAQDAWVGGPGGLPEAGQGGGCPAYTGRPIRAARRLERRKVRGEALDGGRRLAGRVRSSARRLRRSAEGTRARAEPLPPSPARTGPRGRAHDPACAFGERRARSAGRRVLPVFNRRGVAPALPPEDPCRPGADRARLPGRGAGPGRRKLSVVRARRARLRAQPVRAARRHVRGVAGRHSRRVRRLFRLDRGRDRQGPGAGFASLQARPRRRGGRKRAVRRRPLRRVCHKEPPALVRRHGPAAGRPTPPACSPCATRGRRRRATSAPPPAPTA